MRTSLLTLVVLGLTSSLFAQGQPLLYTVPFKAGDAGYLIYRIAGEVKHSVQVVLDLQASDEVGVIPGYSI